MSLKRRNGNAYLYRNKKVNGKVVTEYVGSGRSAVTMSITDILARRLNEEARRKALEQIDEECREDARVQAEIDDRLTILQAHLYAAGFHRPGRWKWRRRRDGGEGQGARQESPVG